ncbi:MAG: alpha-1,4-glucan--maltose-1-phosphate maltosyltransferase [Reyranella sp.]
MATDAPVMGACEVPKLGFAPTIFYLPTALAGPVGDWAPYLERARQLGFDHLGLPPLFAADCGLTTDFESANPALAAGDSVDVAAARIAELCRRHDCKVAVDIVLDRIANQGPASAATPAFAPLPSAATVDPRVEPAIRRSLFANLGDPEGREAFEHLWIDRLSRLGRNGLAVFRLIGLQNVPQATVATIIAGVRAGAPCRFLGWTPGLPWPALSGLAGIGLDGVFASVPWWDGRASWFVAEHEILRRIAPVIGMAAAPSEDGAPGQSRHKLEVAAATSAGLLVSAATDADSDISAALDLFNRLRRDEPEQGLRSLTGPGEPVTALRRGRHLVLINPDHGRDHAYRDQVLAPAEVRVVSEPPQSLIVGSFAPALRAAVTSGRIVIDKISPQIDRGQFVPRRLLDQPIAVEADIFMDGHDVLAAELQWRAADQAEWQTAPMSPLGNDRWRAGFTPDRIGRWEFAIEAWLDELATVRHALTLKRAAGVDTTVEEAEEAALLATTARRTFASRSAVLPIDIERAQAAFASWYEMFPRSATRDARRPGTLVDVIGELPRIRDMGFDVLYFPPIHPIGTSHRKGRNNSLTAAPDDVGSPYAIGSPEGGHDALHPGLGTFEDFRKLVAAARAHGLEIALDFAIQCSPDHPWLSQHPNWFRRRPDGTIKYAENPPKKYEDIVNVDFHGKGATALWRALRDVVLFWIDEGVRLFRVDNPHTKPLAFWQWMIAEVRGRHPDVVFLSEAFTRPKMMYRLAKVGFSQSYTYFTWRNSRHELTEYMTELTTTDVVDYFRPHFFVNTPDINPVYLQTSGRAGFLIRAVLATTLSGLWGMYSGFEICEAAPLPGREEYLDSEKYEIRVRDFDAPGNIVSEITRLNRIRRAHPALHSHLGLAFYNADNGQVLVYGKALPSHEDMIFAVVSLDPHHAQEVGFEIPLWEWRLPDNGALEAEDLMTGRRFTLTGKHQHLRLDPSALPFALWRIWPQ